MSPHRLKHFSTLLIIATPAILGYYLLNFQDFIWKDVVFHYFYVLFSALIALGFSALSYLEYRRTQMPRIFLMSVGFLGVSIIYGFHALITPGMSLFEFPDAMTHTNAFVFFGDTSRLWLALMIFAPTFLLNILKNKGNVALLLMVAIGLLALSLLSLWNPEFYPQVKRGDGSDTYYAVLIKVATLILLGVNALRYYESYQIKANTSILSFTVGLVLIMETVVIFMISKPWSTTWWLAHHLFLSSYVFMGIGVLLSFLKKHSFEYFDVIGQIQNYVSQLEGANKELDRRANNDMLTGLPNRSYFMNHLEQSIVQAREMKQSFGILFIDLDGFKGINDEFGHKVGDEVLKLSAKMLTQTIRTDDVMARLGGDEFIALIKNADRTQIGLIAQRILDSFSDPLVIENKLCKVGTSIGIAMFPDHGYSLPELIQLSDKAMYKVKATSKHNYAFASKDQ